jgi:copper resistance protein D
MRNGWAGRTDMAVQTMHILAASAWLGSLPALGHVLFEARGNQTGAWHAVARDVLPRYSRAGYAAVGLIFLTGSFNSWTLVANIHDLVGSTYGRILLAKIGLIGLMVALALVNRFGLAPVVTKRGSTALEIRMSLSTLRRTVAFEQLLGLMVLGAVSVLGTIAPSMMG